MAAELARFLIPVAFSKKHGRFGSSRFSVLNVGMMMQNIECSAIGFQDLNFSEAATQVHLPVRPLSRRKTFALIASLLAGVPTAMGQERKSLVIGYLGSESPELYASRLKAFRAGIETAGFVEGQNLAIHFRWAAGHYDRLPALARELVDQNVSMIVAAGGASVALAAQKATRSVPIVFELGGDPVKLGLVESLSRPGGNLTGISSLSVEVSAKRLEFMHTLFPNAKTFTVIANPKSPTAELQLTSLRATAKAFELEIDILMPNSEANLEAILTGFSATPASGIVFTSDPYFAFRSQRLAMLAVEHRVPAIMQTRDFVSAGGLMSYGGDFAQSHRQAGIYTGRILKGERPSELPVQLVTKLEFYLNLASAKILGISCPPALISIADSVVD